MVDSFSGPQVYLSKWERLPNNKQNTIIRKISLPKYFLGANQPQKLHVQKLLYLQQTFHTCTFNFHGLSSPIIVFKHNTFTNRKLKKKLLDLDLKLYKHTKIQKFPMLIWKFYTIQWKKKYFPNLDTKFRTQKQTINILSSLYYPSLTTTHQK